MAKRGRPPKSAVAVADPADFVSDEVERELSEYREEKPDEDSTKLYDDGKGGKAPFKDLLIDGALGGVTEEERPAIPHDKCETWGKRIKAVCEASTALKKGFRVTIEDIHLNNSKEWYTVKLRDAEGRRGSATFSVDESDFLETHPKRCGKWLRRIANAALGRKLDS